MATEVTHEELDQERTRAEAAEQDLLELREFRDEAAKVLAGSADVTDETLLQLLKNQAKRLDMLEQGVKNIGRTPIERVVERQQREIARLQHVVDTVRLAVHQP